MSTIENSATHIRSMVININKQSLKRKLKPSVKKKPKKITFRYCLDCKKLTPFKFCHPLEHSACTKCGGRRCKK